MKPDEVLNQSRGDGGIRTGEDLTEVNALGCGDHLDGVGGRQCKRKLRIRDWLSGWINGADRRPDRIGEG